MPIDDKQWTLIRTGVAVAGSAIALIVSVVYLVDALDLLPEDVL